MSSARKLDLLAKRYYAKIVRSYTKKKLESQLDSYVFRASLRASSGAGASDKLTSFYLDIPLSFRPYYISYKEHL